MKKYQKWICMMLVAAILCAGCDSYEQQESQPSLETLAPETAATEPMTEETQQTQPPETEQTQPPAETMQSFSQMKTGYYILTAYQSEEGVTLTGEAAERMMCYVRVNENRSGQFYQMGTFTRLEWSDRYVIIDGTSAKFTLDDDQITIVRAGIDQMTFIYCGETLPEYLQHPELKAGIYYVCMYTYADEIYIVENPGPEFGYLELREDKTGTLSFFTEDVELKWHNNNLQEHSNDMPYAYYEVEQDGVVSQLLVIRYSAWYTLVFCAEGAVPPGDYSSIISEL